MTAALILEFEGVTAREYDAVNEALGLDPRTGRGDWPEGLLHHTGGVGEDGRFVVAEVWDSPEDQARFMEQRLGAALAGAGVGEPVRVAWLEVVAHHSPR